MKQKKILTVTLNPAVDFTVEVDHFTVDAVNRASSGRKDPGGKGINVATALAQGGFPVAVTGFLGKDNRDIFQKHFENHALDDRFVLLDGATREGIKIVDPVRGVTTDVNFPGFQLKPPDLERLSAQFEDLVRGFDYVVLSGSLPPGVPPDFYGRLARLAVNAGAFTAVDTSGEALLETIESGAADLIKPNSAELREIYPALREAGESREAVDRLADSLLEKVGRILLSRGEKGARLYSRSGIRQVSAPEVAVKSTVGAGDAFLAGFVAGLARELDEADALKNAAAWAASKLTRFGPGLNLDNPPSLFLDAVDCCNGG